MAEGKKFKPIKAVGRVRTEENREERMQEGLDAHLQKIASMYSDQGRPLDVDKVKQYMALFKHARTEWDNTPEEVKRAMDREQPDRHEHTKTTDAMLEGIDVHALIQELKNKAARGMEKVTDDGPSPEEMAAFRAIMGGKVAAATPPPAPVAPVSTPDIDAIVEAAVRKALKLKEDQKPGETELG